MGNEIAYLMPPQYKIFLGKGALPPYNPRQGPAPWTPANTLPRHLADRLSFPQACAKAWRQSGEMIATGGD